MKTMVMETRARCPECSYTWAECRPIEACPALIRRVAWLYVQGLWSRYWSWTFTAGVALYLWWTA